MTLNSYYLAEDGKHKFYEVMFVDPTHPSILNDRDRVGRGRKYIEHLWDVPDVGYHVDWE